MQTMTRLYKLQLNTVPIDHWYNNKIKCGVCGSLISSCVYNIFNYIYLMIIYNH